MSKTSDVILSEEKWEKIHKSHKINKVCSIGIKSFSNDPTVASYKKFLDNYKKDLKKGIFLDLGCGIAYVSALLAKERIKIVGVDITSEAITKSKKLFEQEKLKGKFIQADLLNLPLKNESIQFIWSCMSLEYMRDTQKAVNEAYRVLKKGGKIVAVVPVISLTTLTYHQLRGDIPNLPIIRDVAEWLHLKILKGKYMHYGYEKSFTGGQLKRVFSNAGFRVNKLDFFNMYYPISFIPEILRPFFQKILRYRPFWPLVYVEACK